MTLLRVVATVKDPDAWAAFTTPIELDFADNQEKSVSIGARLPFAGKITLDKLDRFEKWVWCFGQRLIGLLYEVEDGNRIITPSSTPTAYEVSRILLP